MQVRAKVGSPYFDWAAARRRCPGGSTEGMETSRRSVAKVLQTRNAKLREHNTRWWGAEETKHIFYELALATSEYCQCRRVGCRMGGRKPWAAFKGAARSHHACQGQRMPNEMSEAYVPEELIVGGDGSTVSTVVG